MNTAQSKRKTAPLIKGTWTLLVITQNSCEHTNLLGNEQWRAVDCIETL